MDFPERLTIQSHTITQYSSDGTQHVDAGDELIGSRSRLDVLGPTHQQRYSVAAFPYIELETKQVSIQTMARLVRFIILTTVLDMNTETGRIFFG